MKSSLTAFASSSTPGRCQLSMPALRELPKAVIDAELVACDEDDKPDFMP